MPPDWASLNPRRLAPQILDQKAQESPDRIYARIPTSTSHFEQGFDDITYAQVANGVNGVAAWLSETLGDCRDKPTFETICYMGGNDFMMPLLVLGAIKAGYKAMFASLRKGLATHENSFYRAQCTKILVTVGSDIPMVSSITSAVPGSKVYEIPTVKHFLHSQKFEHFTYDKTFEQAKDEPFAVVSSGGTTGLPKILLYTHSWASKFAAERYLAPPQGYDSLDYLMGGNVMFTPGPATHASTMWAQVIWPLFCDNIVILPPRDALPSVESSVKGIIASQADVGVWFPTLLESLAIRPNLIDRLATEASKATIFYCGGTVSTKAGDTISTKLKLWNLTGSTEAGMWPGIRREGPWDPRIWRGTIFHPAAGVTMREVSPGVCSGIIVRRDEDPEGSLLQPIFTLFPDAKEVDSGDLFAPLVVEGYENESLWVVEGRKDDLQIMLHGFNWRPTDIEHKIAYMLKDTDVTQVLIVSHRLPFTILLLETKHDRAITKDEIDQLNHKLIEDHWHEIVKVNDRMDPETHLNKNLVIFTTPEKPMQRSVKGTVRRIPTVRDYEDEIYERLARNGWKKGDYVDL